MVDLIISLRPRWGRLMGKVRRSQPLPAQSRLDETAYFRPPINDDHFFRIVGAL